MTNLEKRYTSDLAEERRLLQCENAKLAASNARMREACDKISLHCYMAGNPNSPRYMHAHWALDAISMIIKKETGESPAASLAAIQDAATKNIVVRCHGCQGTLIFKRTDNGELEVFHDCAQSWKKVQDAARAEERKGSPSE